MEIGGIPSFSAYTPPQASDARAPKATAQESRNEGAVQAALARAPRSDKRDTAERTKPVEVQRVQSIQTATLDSIQIGIEDGKRVMKVRDTKEYQIYQVPAKGELMLIQADERAAARQVQTSA